MLLRRPLIRPLSLIFLMTSSLISAHLTYHDASLANTVRWDGLAFQPVTGGTSVPDDNWEVRSFANEGNIFESNADGPEDAPMLVTTIDGLSPNTEYIVKAYFWHDGRNWRLKASLDPSRVEDNQTLADKTDDSLPSDPLTHFAATGSDGGRATWAPLANSDDFVDPPLLSEGNRDLRQADLGIAMSDANGRIEVLIDDLAGADEGGRTWYDGLAYRIAPALDPALDQDEDGLSNGDEAELGTDPYRADSDGDSFSDASEVDAGSDPLDPKSIPVAFGGAIPIAPDGAWTWFNDERAIFHQGSLFVGYVTRDGDYGVTRYDPATNTSRHMTISTPDSRQRDDHNNPSITPLPSGKLLLLYAKHNSSAEFYQRTSLVDRPATEADWGPERIHPLPGRNTYNNTYRLSTENDRIYNFHRSINFNPTLTRSDDLGESWEDSLHFIETGSGGTRPYPRYLSNGEDRIDLIYTDGHPRNDNNSIYHLYYRNGGIFKTNGTLITDFDQLPLDHDGGQRGTVVYAYSDAPWGPEDGPDDWLPGGRAWTWDIHYDAEGRPVCAFQVQRDDVTGSGWNHDRIYYYYARWDGSEWQKHFIAHGGRGLYPHEDDYGGGMAIDPDHPNVVYIASNAAHPFEIDTIDDVPLAANERYEIYRGTTLDGGRSFDWEPVTVDSPADNLRPIVPENHGYDRAVLWFQGNYESYTNFDCQVLGIFRNDLENEGFSMDGDAATLQWRSSPGQRYEIQASPDLIDFSNQAAADIESEGGSTRHEFEMPPTLKDAGRGFFRVREQ